MLKSDQNCIAQDNLSIGGFSDAGKCVQTLNAFMLKLHFGTGSQDFSGTSWPILIKFAGLM